MSIIRLVLCPTVADYRFLLIQKKGLLRFNVFIMTTQECLYLSICWHVQKSCIMEEMSEVLNTIHVQFQIDDD